MCGECLGEEILDEVLEFIIEYNVTIHVGDSKYWATYSSDKHNPYSYKSTKKFDSPKECILNAIELLQ